MSLVKPISSCTYSRDGEHVVLQMVLGSNFNPPKPLTMLSGAAVQYHLECLSFLLP